MKKGIPRKELKLDSVKNQISLEANLEIARNKGTTSQVGMALV
jgi:hypothetical protein